MSLNTQDCWIVLKKEDFKDGYIINLKHVEVFRYGSNSDSTKYWVELTYKTKEYYDSYFNNKKDLLEFLDFLYFYFGVKTVKETINNFKNEQ